MHFAFTDARLDAIKRDGATVTLDVPVSAPDGSATIVVYDEGGDQVGSAVGKIH